MQDRSDRRAGAGRALLARSGAGDLAAGPVDPARARAGALPFHLVRHRTTLRCAIDGTWSPETDACIPQRYAAETLEDKAANTRHLRRRFGLRKGERPVVAYVGRLDAQKGVHLIHHALFYTLGLGGQFVVLGASPDPAISNHLQQLDRQLDGHPDVHLELQFNQELRTSSMRVRTSS